MGLFRKIADAIVAVVRHEFCEEKQPGTIMIMGARFRPIKPGVFVRVRRRK
jgi:hypothetical protein